MEDVILEVRGICKYFGQLVANEDINMSVRRAVAIKRARHVALMPYVMD